MANDKEYWLCMIGPTKRSELEPGADGPMRFAVKERFGEVTGRNAGTCYSGWGVSEKMAQMLMTCWHMPESKLAKLLKKQELK